MQGLYPILATPFDGADRIDVEDLRREVDFVIENGVHGVGIAFASEVVKLSGVGARCCNTDGGGTGCRTGARGGEYRSAQHGGDCPVQQAGRGARGGRLDGHAAGGRVGGGRQGVLPPGLGRDDNTDLHPGTCPRRRCRPRWRERWPAEIEGVQYIKAENPPTPASIAGFVKEGRRRADGLRGRGRRVLRWRRCVAGRSGSCRTRRCPTCSARCGNLFQSGDEAGAVAEFNRMTPLLRVMTQGAGPSSLHLVKETLRLRGVFTSVNVRHPDTPPSEFTYRELREAVDAAGLAL